MDTQQQEHLKDVAKIYEQVQQLQAEFWAKLDKFGIVANVDTHDLADQDLNDLTLQNVLDGEY